MVKPIPDGYHSVTPYLVVTNVRELIDFLTKAFGAKTTEKYDKESGDVWHADVMIGDSHVMMGQAGEQWKAMQSSLYLYVPDVDATYKQAVAAGGKSLREPTTEFYGDRSAGVTDPFGNQWWMATHVEDVSPEEMERRAKAAGKL